MDDLRLPTIQCSLIHLAQNKQTTKKNSQYSVDENPAGVVRECIIICEAWEKSNLDMMHLSMI